MESSYDSLPVWIDTDNALGSKSGDIDDGFAIAAALKLCKNIIGFSSTFGNTSSIESKTNTEEIIKLMNFNSEVFLGAADKNDLVTDASKKLASLDEPFIFVALGPLTNLHAALKLNKKLKDKIQMVLWIGTNIQNLPSWRIFDFNLYNDKNSLKFLLEAGIEITAIPCSVARNIRSKKGDLENLPLSIRGHFMINAARWFKRAFLLKASKTIPVWDLSAIFFLTHRTYFNIKTRYISSRDFRRSDTKDSNHPYKLHQAITFDDQKIQDLASHTLFSN